MKIFHSLEALENSPGIIVQTLDYGFRRNDGLIGMHHHSLDTGLRPSPQWRLLVAMHHRSNTGLGLLAQ